MNKPIRHMRYRRSVYRKKRIQIILATIGGVLLAAFIAFVIIGNILGDKVEDAVSERVPNSQQEQPFVHGEIKKVRAYPTPLYVEGSSQLSNRIKSTAAKGYTEACFDLDSLDGTVYYNSDIATSLGYQDPTNAMRKLSDAADMYKSNGLYTIGITHMSEYISAEGDLQRSAAMGYYSARIAEALRAGVDDVLIYTGDLPAEQYLELIHLADEIHRLCPDGKIGISISANILKNEENADIIESLWRAFDYLAADISIPAEDTDVAIHVSNELGGMLYFLLRYELRVLAPNATDDVIAQKIIDAVNLSGSQNVMIMP